MILQEILERIDVWEDWRKNYKTFVPQFIQEASQKMSWQDWNKVVFQEYFERSNGQSVSSLQQGYFTNNEKEVIKQNWQAISPILKQIADSQDEPQFNAYAQLKSTILQLTDSNKEAAIHRLVAGLQPKLLSTIVTYKHLNELYSLLIKKARIKIPGYSYQNWFKDSHLVWQFFKKTLPGKDPYDLITYPWQTLEFLRDTDINKFSMELKLQELVSLITYKKQIILQGPPGTGKTKLAKDLAAELIAANTITENDIKLRLKVGLWIKSATAYTSYTIKNIGDGNVTVGLKDSESEYKPSYKEIIKAYQTKMWNGGQVKGNDPYAAAIAKYIFESINPDQLKLVQFHPSYSYEDFVRGIVAESKGDRLEYRAVDKILSEFASNANDNFVSNSKDDQDFQKDKWIRETFNDFMEEVARDVEQKEIQLSGNIGIFELDSSCFRYGKDWGVPSRLNFNDIRKLIRRVIDGQLSPTATSIPKEFSLHAHYRSTYYLALLRLFFQKYSFAPTQARPPLKNYVLIIDEINRANLSSVLGELIFALEYREEQVDGLYAVEGSNKLVLPPNLYIIGTMNTADRSVGHIDYAIRRRFAFVDVLPEVLKTNDEIVFHEQLFREVAGLFINNLDGYIADKNVDLVRSNYLSQEFLPKDIWLGHSYFIQKKEKDGNGHETLVPASINLRVQYEIIPILEEYLKDGVLIDNGGENPTDDKSVKAVINKLKAGEWQTA